MRLRMLVRATVRMNAPALDSTARLALSTARTTFSRSKNRFLMRMSITLLPYGLRRPTSILASLARTVTITVEMELAMTTTVKMIVLFGVGFGCFGWVMGLALTCFIVGEVGVLRTALVPALVMSAGLGALFVMVSELANRHFGAGHRLAALTMFGALVYMLGLLVYVINWWLAPQIDRAPALAKAIVSLPGAYRVSDGVPTIGMVIGMALLLAPLAHLLRGDQSPRQSV